MSHSHHVNQFLVDPNLAYLPHPGLPPPPGVPFEGTHPPMPMGPPAVLVDNVVEILKPLQEEVERVGKVLTDISDTTFDTSETIHELSERMKSLEVAVKKKLDLSMVSSSDDEGPGGTQGDARRRPKKRAREDRRALFSAIERRN